MQMTLPNGQVGRNIPKMCSNGTESSSVPTPLLDRLLEWIRDPYHHRATVQRQRRELDAIHSEIITLKMSDPNYCFNSKDTD